MTEYDGPIYFACNKCLLAPVAKAKLHSHQSEFLTNDLFKTIWPLMMISQLRLKAIRLRKPLKTTSASVSLFSTCWSSAGDLRHRAAAEGAWPWISVKVKAWTPPKNHLSLPCLLYESAQKKFNYCICHSKHTKTKNQTWHNIRRDTNSLGGQIGGSRSIVPEDVLRGQSGFEATCIQKSM